MSTLSNLVAERKMKYYLKGREGEYLIGKRGKESKAHECPDCGRPCTCCIEAVDEPNYCTHDCDSEARRRSDEYWENRIDEAIEERVEREGK